MKYVAQNEMYNIEFNQLKEVVVDCLTPQVSGLVQKALILINDEEDLKDLIQQYPWLAKQVFLALKQRLDMTNSHLVMEETLVMMKLLLPWHQPLYVKFREKFLAYFMSSQFGYLTCHNYTIIRHLVKVAPWKRSAFLNQFIHHLDEHQYYELALIYLVEKDEKSALQCLKHCEYRDELLAYDGILKTLHPFKYRHHALKTPWFDFDRNDLWRKQPLKS